MHSGLSSKDAEYAARNILLAYATIELDDKVRDSRILVRPLASKLRSKLKDALPKGLRRYIVSVDEKIAEAERATVGLEEYVCATGSLGGIIFKLATPYKSEYDEDFVAEVGSLSTQLMIMGDMNKDLCKDLESGKYNPLKYQRDHDGFNQLYTNAQERLIDLMKKTGIYRITDSKHKGLNICSDKIGGCKGKAVAILGACCIIGGLIAFMPALHYCLNRGYYSNKPCTAVFTDTYKDLWTGLGMMGVLICCAIPLALFACYMCCHIDICEKCDC